MCFRSMQSTERGKKVNAALVQTGKVVAQTGKAVGKENIVIFQKFTINDAGVCDKTYAMVCGLFSTMPLYKPL